LLARSLARSLADGISTFKPVRLKFRAYTMAIRASSQRRRITYNLSPIARSKLIAIKVLVKSIRAIKRTRTSSTRRRSKDREEESRRQPTRKRRATFCRTETKNTRTSYVTDRRPVPSKVPTAKQSVGLLEHTLVNSTLVSRGNATERAGKIVAASNSRLSDYRCV